MLVYIFKELEIDISYMVGGFSESLNSTIDYATSSTKFSIVEGDEYLSSKIDKRSKFFHYSPKYLIINSVEWDHTDLFKSEQDYIENFKELISQMPSDGVLFVNDSDNIRKVIDGTALKVIKFNKDEFSFENNLVGKFNKENAYFATQVASTILDLPQEKVQNVLKSFKGIKRRMELRFKDNDVIVIDDFGSSPAKAKGAIESVKESFPDYKIYVIYEPNEGARLEHSLSMYNDAFMGVEKIILPKFREMKDRITSTDLEAYLSTLDCGYKVRSVENNLLTEEILDSIDERSVVLFLGSHDFEFYISNLIDSLK
jgi:UDP-N-acetylmuramate: L-alanyl-gamma-D-glutamyl-meso-diaminopimelate ligase